MLAFKRRVPFQCHSLSECVRRCDCHRKFTYSGMKQRECPIELHPARLGWATIADKACSVDSIGSFLMSQPLPPFVQEHWSKRPDNPRVHDTLRRRAMAASSRFSRAASASP